MHIFIFSLLKNYGQIIISKLLRRKKITQIYKTCYSVILSLITHPPHKTFVHLRNTN